MARVNEHICILFRKETTIAVFSVQFEYKKNSNFY